MQRFVLDYAEQRDGNQISTLAQFYSVSHAPCPRSKRSMSAIPGRSRKMIGGLMRSAPNATLSAPSLLLSRLDAKGCFNIDSYGIPLAARATLADELDQGRPALSRSRSTRYFSPDDDTYGAASQRPCSRSDLASACHEPRLTIPIPDHHYVTDRESQAARCEAYDQFCGGDLRVRLSRADGRAC